MGGMHQRTSWRPKHKYRLIKDAQESQTKLQFILLLIVSSTELQVNAVLQSYNHVHSLKKEPQNAYRQERHAETSTIASK